MLARLRNVYSPFQTLIHEIAKFGIVGAINYVVDVGLFNILVVSLLSSRPLTAKGISTIVAATSSYFMNRHWTWKDRARTGVRREYLLFLVLSAIALGITLGCLAFGEYVLHQDSLLARNFWGNIVGVGVAMVFRFWSFKRWVFLEPEPSRTADAERAALV
ncbi:MAG TPA: GtrA family protein [Mycobacteriales bacterium]|nr:GtrA family protein [Mycobacteriales bacterium]